MGALSSSIPLRCKGSPRLSEMVPSCYHQVEGGAYYQAGSWYPAHVKGCTSPVWHPSSCNPTLQPSSSTDGPHPSLGFDGYGDGFSIEWPPGRDGTSHLEDWLPSRKKERVHSSCAPSISLPPHAGIPARRGNSCYFTKGPVSTGVQ